MNVRFGWMDSTDFECELGEAPGFQKIYSTREELEAASPCINKADSEGFVQCKAVKVRVEIVNE